MHITNSQLPDCRQDQTSRNHSRGLTTIVVGLLLAAMALAGCSGHERRTTGTVLNDQQLEYSIIESIRSNPNFGEHDHIKVEVHQGLVLLTGETVSEQNRLVATHLAEKPKLARRVYPYIEIGRRAHFGGKLDNAILTTKVNSVLMAKNTIPGFDPARIKVVSSQNTVYLMGIVTHDEGEKITEVVRNIGGVELVRPVFDFTD